MAKPLVAIVGRPNVGKSMLFNKLTGQRTSIVEDTPGVTRDRIYGSCEWCGRTFSLVDTGGIEPGTDSEMLKFMRRQAEIGIELADAIIMVVDVHSGVTAADQDVATMLRKSGKPIALAVNKCDSVGPVNPDVYEFYSLGIGDLFETSAIHGHGTGDLLDWVLENIPEDSGEEEDSDVIKVAIVGKPNVGKSSLLNRILGEERVIVSDVAGTTRDAIDSRFTNAQGSFVFIDTAGIRRKSKVEESVEKYSVLRATMAIERSDSYFENETGKYCFIDTAGMRRKSKVDDAIEKYSNMRSISAIDRADVCLILIDANDGVTEQDTKIAGLVHEAGKAAVIVVNKWDAVENKETNTMRDMETKVRQGLSYMLYAPVLFLSALTGQRVDRLFQVIQDVHAQNTSRITTGALNSVLADATARVQPPTDKGRRLKIFYMTQASTKPPHFVIFCNDARLFHFSYQRYLENQIREVFGLNGTPIRITIRQRGDKEDE